MEPAHDGSAGCAFPEPEASMAARELAALQGCGAETLGASTLHLFWNLLGMVPRDSVVMNVDAGT